MTRDKLLNEMRNAHAGWPALVGLWALLVIVMVLAGRAVIGG